MELDWSCRFPLLCQLTIREFEHTSVIGKGVKRLEVFDKVKEIIVEQLGVDPDEVTLEASFVEDLGADSLDVVELVMAFEEEFDLKIPDEDAEKISLVKDAVEYQ